MSDGRYEYFSYVHFDEFDGLGLLHHTQYLIHLERAQQALFQHLLGVENFDADRDKDIYVVVHGLDIRFKKAMANPGLIRIIYTVQRIRAGGLTLAFEIFEEVDGALLSDGRRTVCKLSNESHQPTPWSERFAEKLAEMRFSPTDA